MRLSNVVRPIFIFAVIFCWLSIVSVHRAEARKTVYFSAITLYHPIVMYQKYQPLMNYLSKNTPYNFELKLNRDYRNIMGYLAKKEVQLALLGGSTYVLAKQKIDIIPILKPLGADGSPFYRSVIVTRSNNASINSLKDLRNKSVAFPSVFSTSGFLTPVYHLYADANISLTDLSRHENFRYHDTVAREVLRGNFDAGAVIDVVAKQFENRGLKKIWTSPPIPGLPIVVRADEDPELVAAVKKALLALDYSNPDHRVIMSEWDAELRYGFSVARDKDYDTQRKMVIFLKKRGVSIP
ncbi:MAG: hypothetical protein A2X80_11685 [Geobacteraceae bacterium GWB2_52_12]|nr:MAG: hypothetical protein A2X80_11685 [Geobacteraceae bacterium GWB2_52_12]